MNKRKSTRLVLGNWKMFGNFSKNASLLEGLKILSNNSFCEIGVCVPFPYLFQVALSLQGSKCFWGAQDISAHDYGAYTGEVSGSMLKEFGCKFVIVGHSERRFFHGETDLDILRKTEAAVRHDLIPVVCVGETLNQYKSGDSFEVIRQQLSLICDLDKNILSKVVISYEPVWAIGAGSSADPNYAQKIHCMIRHILQDRGIHDSIILYGGSVKPNNAFDLFSMPDIDGALVGGSSLSLEEFSAIISAK